MTGSPAAGWALGLPRRRPAARAEPRPGHAARRVGLSEGAAVRVSLLSAGLWWAGFTIIPRARPARPAPARRPRPSTPAAGVVRGSLGQLARTFARAAPLPADPAVPARLPVLQRRHPDRDRHLQPVRRRGAAPRARASCITTVLLVQFVAFVGALLFGRLRPQPRRLADGAATASSCGCWSSSSPSSCPQGACLVFLALGGADRHRPRRQPGAVPVAVQPAHPPRPGGGVLQPLPGDGARHELARHPGLRPRATSSPAPTGGRSSRWSSSSSSAACCCRGCACGRASTRPATPSPRSSERAAGRPPGPTV